MKKSIKLLTIALMLLVVMTVAFGVTVSAEDAEEIKIVSKSAYFGDQTYLYYAVDDTALADGQTLEVLLYTEDPRINSEAEAYKAALSELVYPYNADYPVYQTFGIPAKAIADTVYAVVHVVGSEISFDKVVEYSVLEYLYELKFMTDLSTAKKELGEALINYADKSQVAFNYKAESLASDYYYAYVSVGSFDGTNYSALFDPDATAEDRTVTPVADGVNKWSVYKYDAEGNVTRSVVNANTPIIVDAHTIIKAGGAYDFEESDDINSYLGVSPNGKPFRKNTGSWTDLSIANDPIYGNVVAHTNSSNKTEAYMDIADTTTGANTFAYQADMKIDYGTATGTKIYQLTLMTKADNAYRIIFEIAGVDSAITIKGINGAGGVESTTTTEAIEGKWFNIRVEYSLTEYNYNKDNGVDKDALVRVYINDKCAFIGYTPFRNTDTTKQYAADQVTTVFWQNNSSYDVTGITTFFDNITLEHCDTNIPSVANFDDGIRYYVQGGTIVADEERGSNVIKYVSNTSSATDNRMYVINSVEGANAVAFDAYVKFDCADTVQQNLELLFAGSKSIKIVFYGYDKNNTNGDFKGNLRVNNVANAGISLVNNIAPEGEWFHLRYEYINNGDTATVNVIVNGTTVATSNAAAVVDIDSIKYLGSSLYKSDGATVYYDDVSVLQYIAE